MKSILVMFVGLGICILALYLMFDGHVRGFSGAKWYWITGGTAVVVGLLMNHHEHTRRN